LEFAATLNENSNNLVSQFFPALAKMLLLLW
jgi:IS30 family transposase